MKFLLGLLLFFFITINASSQSLLRNVNSARINPPSPILLDYTTGNSEILNIASKIEDEIRLKIRLAGIDTRGRKEKFGFFTGFTQVQKVSSDLYLYHGNLQFNQEVRDLDSNNSQMVITWQESFNSSADSRYEVEKEIINKYKELTDNFLKAYFKFN